MDTPSRSRSINVHFVFYGCAGHAEQGVIENMNNIFKIFNVSIRIHYFLFRPLAVVYYLLLHCIVNSELNTTFDALLNYVYYMLATYNYN